MRKCRLLSTMKLLLLIPSPLYPVDYKKEEEVANDTEEMEIITLKQRLQEIGMKGKSKLTFEQKNAIKKEIKSIKDRLQRIGGGLYLSIGSVLLLIILLISLFLEKYF